jgi:hypothetical protein
MCRVKCCAACVATWDAASLRRARPGAKWLRIQRGKVRGASFLVGWGETKLVRRGVVNSSLALRG